MTQVDAIRWAFHPDHRIGLQEIRRAVTKISTKIGHFLRCSSVLNLRTACRVLDVENGCPLVIKHVGGVGSNQVLIAGVLAKVAN